MKIIPETEQDIVAIIASEFRSFGGGKGSDTNPIAAALKNNPPTFAAGVDIAEVVNRVIGLSKTIKTKKQ